MVRTRRSADPAALRRLDRNSICGGASTFDFSLGTKIVRASAACLQTNESRNAFRCDADLLTEGTPGSSRDILRLGTRGSPMNVCESSSLFHFVKPTVARKLSRRGPVHRIWTQAPLNQAHRTPL